MTMKRVSKIVLSKWQSEGRGARVRRSIGRPELRNLDPFLLLDEFEGSGAEGAGFPDHPHRGFETVSYLLEGEFTHEDFAGNKGVLKPGDLQWMTAGRGIVHSEMPGWERTRGLQLWVNLASEYKMVEPQYQELSADQIPVAAKDGVSVKVIAGTSLGVSSQVRTRTPTYYLDITLAPGASHRQEVPDGWTTFVYILEGKLKFGDKAVDAHNTVLFSHDGDDVEILNEADIQGHCVLIAGRPIGKSKNHRNTNQYVTLTFTGEPIAQHGPFVMNTQEEILQAFQDFQQGKNGFEKARKWKSVEGNK